MRFYFTDYYELDNETINKIVDYLRNGWEFEGLFEEFVGTGPQAYLVYDQVKTYIKTLLTPAEIQQMEANEIL